MIDMIEARVIAKQVADHLIGKKISAAEIAEGKQGSMRDGHLITVEPEQFRECLAGTRLADAYSKYRHICIETDGQYGIHFWDVFGRVLYIESGAKAPGNPPITLWFEDGSRLIVLPGVWGAMRVATREELRAFRASTDADIVDTSSADFTEEAVKRLLGLEMFQKSTIKEVLTRYNSPGFMSMMGALCQEALYRARVHPKRKVKDISEEEIVALHRAMKEVTCDAIAAGGRASERDLFDKPGGFVATVSKASEGQPCPACGAAIQSVKLGGAGSFYICPGCQVL